MYHPGRRVWVELHWALVPPWSPAGADGVFRVDTVRAERGAATFRGRAVNRLSDDLQLVYLANHWAFGLRRVGGVVAMLDVLRLLRHAPALRWERIVAWLDDSPVAATCLYLLLTYFRRHRLAAVDPAVLRAVAARQRAFGTANLAILHAIVDRYVVGGRPLGRLMSQRNFDIVWTTLLSPGRPSQNLGRALWTLMPSRAWLARTLGAPARR
jgi:hypothetical protein